MISLQRSIRSITLLAAAAIALGACAESTAPDASGPSFKVTVDHMAPDSMSAVFTVDRSGGTFTLGKHSIYFPGNAICDPKTSTYGIGTWDDRCKVLRQPITITAEIRKVDGKEWVDFSPALRFVPSKEVYIWMYTDQQISGTQPKDLNILWAPHFGAEGIDESLDDPTLVTQALPQHNIVYRRIKHFSGYMVASGIASSLDALTTSTGEGF